MSVEVNVGSQEVFQSKNPCIIICPIHQKKVNMKYLQPPKQKTCAPLNTYHCPTDPLDANTVYHLSYPPVDNDIMRQCRPSPFAIHGNIRLPTGKIEDQSVTTLSYIYTPSKPAQSMKPGTKYMMGAGALQSVTTHRHDFTPKKSERPTKFIPKGNIYPINAKMEDATIMMKSYIPIGNVAPPSSCKPSQEYRSPDTPFEGSTIHQLSYTKPEMGRKEIYPWTLKSTYQQPQHRMEGNTIYSGSFLAPGTFVPCPPIECPGEICLCSSNATDDL